MGIKPYLIFRLHDTRYAIAAAEATEIFLLPELTTVAEAPPDVVGLLNLHSRFVPVMHLDLRFGRQCDRCHLSDSVIVVESKDLAVGVIVHQVETVIDIDDRYIQADLTYGRERGIDEAFVKGAIDLDDEIVLLLDVDNLVRHPNALSTLVEEAERSPSPNNFYDRYFPNASPDNKKILYQRAVNLKSAVADTGAVEPVPIAIISIHGSYFGFDLGVVREFVNIRRVTTIPCCPPHIIGNMNLRGEVLTLVNISQPLNLKAIARQQLTKAVVVEVDGIIAGIAVEEVFDVVDFRPEAIQPVPAATNDRTAAYLKGMTNYQNHLLSVVDLPQLLATGAMTVELTA